MTRSFKITHDRSYWRATPDRVILEAARDSDDELAIALGERLDSYIRACTPITDRIADLETEVEDLKGQIERLQAELDEMDGEGV
jgi:predicted  nucleic acid-binding Zn-ribbon protein